ncbi:MAG: NAD-dependent epimerase/dehydratase family protein [Kiritimatiellae bacterium]|nr:NAD-dependent epimerase/dehydratase family protein [Kiritimatiellia bacterium]
METPITTVAELEDRLSQPTAGAVEALRGHPGDIAVLGIGGKMGLTLARMARRVMDHLGRKDRVLGMARFSTPGLPAELERNGIVPIKCDLLNRAAVQNLPDATNVIFMAGLKFGTTSGPEMTWAMNTVAPALVAERYARSRIVVFSTGCVYPFAPVTGGGSREEDELGPPGDYANSCVGRERVFTYFSRKHGTPVAIDRLYYAIDLRYGVLQNIAEKVWRNEPVDVTNGYFNCIWQQEANAHALQCLAHAASPPWIVNATGPEILSVRKIATRLGELLERKVMITGQEAPTAWIANTGKAQRVFGPLAVGVEQMLLWTAHWVKQGGVSLNKPTHFEVRDGKF